MSKKIIILFALVLAVGIAMYFLMSLQRDTVSTTPIEERPDAVDAPLSWEERDEQYRVVLNVSSDVDFLKITPANFELCATWSNANNTGPSCAPSEKPLLLERSANKQQIILGNAASEDLWGCATDVTLGCENFSHQIKVQKLLGTDGTIFESFYIERPSF